MGNLFGNIYYWFVNLFGEYLHSFLWGYDCQTNSWEATNHYLMIGWVMLLTTLLLFAIYYYWLNHPRFNKWWHWLIVGLGAFVINLLFARGCANYYLADGLIPDCLLYTTQPNGEVIQNIYSYHCWMFGVANGIISFVLFGIVSIIGKRWSINCRHTPWKSIFPKRNK